VGKVRVSKHDVVVKQLLNNAMKGNSSGLRMYVDAYRQAFERAAMLDAQRAQELERYNDLDNLSLEELERLYADTLKAEEKDKKK
jgi:hypothetical protein